MKAKLVQLMFLTVAVVLSIIAWNLGQWQTMRAQEKIAIQKKFEAQSQQPVVVFNDKFSIPLPSNPSKEIKIDKKSFEKTWLYRPVQVNGRYLHEQSVFIDNVIYQGQPGVTVITPLLLPSLDIIILVNRGWLSWPDRQVNPLSLLETPNQLIEIAGQFRPIQQNNVFVDSNENRQNTNLILQLNEIVMSSLISKSEQVYIPSVLYTTNNNDGLISPAPLNLDANWVSRHKGYAFQWFLLGILVWIVYSIMLYRYYRKKQSK